MRVVSARPRHEDHRSILRQSCKQQGNNRRLNDRSVSFLFSQSLSCSLVDPQAFPLHVYTLTFAGSTREVGTSHDTYGDQRNSFLGNIRAINVAFIACSSSLIDTSSRRAGVY